MTKRNVPKIALVTGGSNGIGNAIANKLIEENYTVVVADLTKPSIGAKSIFRHCDVTKAIDVDGLFDWMATEIGFPSVLVLNAGIGIHEKLTEGDPEKWNRVMQTNIMGALRFIRAFVPQMQQKRIGHVVFISSVAANNPYAYGGVYGASKAALEQIAETLRLEVLPDIKVSVVAAGITETGFFENQPTSVENINMGAMKPNEIAEDVVYIINKPGAAISKIVTRPPSQNF